VVIAVLLFVVGPVRVIITGPTTTNSTAISAIRR
jgi:hypothetical protein